MKRHGFRKGCTALRAGASGSACVAEGCRLFRELMALTSSLGSEVLGRLRIFRGILKRPSAPAAIPHREPL